MVEPPPGKSAIAACVVGRVARKVAVMHKIGNYLYIASGLVVLLVVLSLATSRSARSAVADAVTDVLVTNSNAQAVPTRDRDDPGRQPFQFMAQPDTRVTGGDRAEIDYTVPSGKELVLDYVSAGIAAGQGDVFVETTAGGSLAAWYFLNGADDTTRSFFPTTIYADPGTRVAIVVTGSNTQADVELSGHFVKLP
jgi:hypothetical protein